MRFLFGFWIAFCAVILLVSAASAPGPEGTLALAILLGGGAAIWWHNRK
jgi:hypothetical protein